MPLDPKLLHTNPMAADVFLGSHKGTILHEIGHYVAANLDGLTCGHIIIPVDTDRHSGAFVPLDLSAEILCSDPARWSLVSSAGVLAEYHFCGRAMVGAARGDFAAYQAVFGLMPEDAIVERWTRDHLDRIAAHAACIEQNFDRCVYYCNSNRFLTDNHHVIPSCAMRPPQQRGLRARLDEAVWTYPIKARRCALDEFLAAQASLAVVRFA